MFDPYNGYSPLTPVETEHKANSSLEAVTRYSAYFGLGVFVTFLVRSFAALQPLYWIVAIGGLLALAAAIHLTRRVQLLAVAAIVLAAMLSGHFDGFTYRATQAINQIEGAVTR